MYVSLEILSKLVQFNGSSIHTYMYLISLVTPEIGFYAHTCRQPIPIFSSITFPLERIQSPQRMKICQAFNWRLKKLEDYKYVIEKIKPSLKRKWAELCLLPLDTAWYIYIPYHSALEKGRNMTIIIYHRLLLLLETKAGLKQNIFILQ